MGKFNRFLLLLWIALSCIAGANAQSSEKKSRGEMRKEIAEFKMKYLAQEMDLKDNQIEQFKELYSKMNLEKRKAFATAMKLERKLRTDKDATEADYEAAAKAMDEAKIMDHDIDKKYDTQFAKFLTAKQRFKMKKAEEDFRKKMEQMHRDKKGKGAKRSSGAK